MPSSKRPRDFPMEPYYADAQAADSTTIASQQFFGTRGVRGVLPFVLHWTMPGPFRGKFGVPSYRHLLFMDDAVVVLAAPGPPPSTSTQVQLDEARTPARFVAEDVNIIRYANVTRVHLYGVRHYTPVPRVTFWSHGAYGASFQFIYPKGRNDLRDKEKIPFAMDLLQRVLPRGVRLAGL